MEAAVVPVAVSLIGVVSVVVASVLTTRRERSRLRHDLALERYREGRQLFDSLVQLAGERYFFQQRWLWAVQHPEKYDLSEVRLRYFEALRRWNVSTWSHRAQLRLSLGDEIALTYLDYADDQRNEPRSLHYQFVHAHRLITDCEGGKSSGDVAQGVLDRLNHAWSNFADDVATELLRRARTLQLLEDRGPNGSATDGDLLTRSAS